MNFLLYMLGRGFGRRHLPGARPGWRLLLVSTAAAHAAAGRLPEALEAYQRLADAGGEAPLDLLVRGNLHLVLGQSSQARECFAQGMERVLDHGFDDGLADETSVERLLGNADQMLRGGLFVRAAEQLRRARAFLDVLQAAQAGMLLADADPLCRQKLLSLVRMSDLTLRMLARTHLARQLAAALQERRLREDLAGWATSTRGVTRLLKKDYQRLAALQKSVPGHVETAYRLGLVAQAVGDVQSAAAAFRTVLGRHPHHVGSAVRLAGIQGDGGTPDLELLRTAFFVPGETLRAFGAFASAAGEKGRFDQAARHLESIMERSDRGAARANLAFALSEVGLLDSARAEWREVAPPPPVGTPIS